MNGRELSIDEEALLPHSDVTVILDSGSSAARRLTNGTFSQFGQLISWANFFSKSVGKSYNRIRHTNQVFWPFIWSAGEQG